MVPFIAVMTTPERVLGYPIVPEIVDYLGITSASQLVLPLTILFILLALIAAAVRMSLLWIDTRLGVVIGADLSAEVYRTTIHQPYEVHVARNSSELITAIVQKVNFVPQLVTGVLQILGSAASLLAVMMVLIAFAPLVALTTLLTFGGGYACIYWLSRRRLHLNSSRIAQESTQVLRSLQEGFGAIRDVILDHSQRHYLEAYSQANRPLRKAQGDILFLSAMPRHLLEAVGMVVIALLAFLFSHQEGGVLGALPVLGVLALGAQRLLPTLQQLYSSRTMLSGNYASLTDVLDLLDQPALPSEPRTPVKPLRFREGIRFDDVCFRYTDNGPWVLDHLDLTIDKGTRVGLVAPSGSGKSTILDILMGLLRPTKGTLIVDGYPLADDSIEAWQRNIAHVPQHIFLADATMTKNIAISAASHEIDVNRVRHVAMQAGLADFIETRPDGYDSLAGERGIRLSGGQRQRIGIARALYKEATVLVFDEATSSLDHSSEESILASINTLSNDLTIIMVSHRPATVRNCDIIIELDHGQVSAYGTYLEHVDRSGNFAQLSQLDKTQLDDRSLPC